MLETGFPSAPATGASCSTLVRKIRYHPTVLYRMFSADRTSLALRVIIAKGAELVSGGVEN